MNRSPEQTHTSLTPLPPFIDPTENIVAFYQLPNPHSHETMITPFNKARTHLAQLSFADYHNTTIDRIHANILETTIEQQAMESTARDFVEQVTGVRTVGNLYWQDKTAPVSYWGVHNQIYMSTYIKEADYPHDDLRYMHQMSSLVHEFAHSTADDGDTTTVFRTNDLNTPDEVFVHSGMNTIKLSYNNGYPTASRNGQFFEEAFAEETAARWREQFSAKIAAEPDALWADDDPTGLPLRFFDYNYMSNGPAYTTACASAAYPAYTLSILTQRTGVDLYNLLCHARQPEQKAEAQASFIRAVNSIDKHLYHTLRELQYTEHDFLEGLAIVRDLVEANHEQTDELAKIKQQLGNINSAEL